MAHENLYVLLEPVVVQLGFELTGIEYLSQGNGSMLRIYIDNEDGVNVDDCGMVSKQVSALLDVEDPIREHYTLEVSSPGSDRLLFKKQHYERFVGSNVKIRLRMPLDGRRNFKGEIIACEDDDVIVDVDGEQFSLTMDNIEKARLVVED